MTRTKRGRGGKRGGLAASNDRRDQADRWAAASPDSPVFHTFYKTQGIVPEDEYEAFNAALHEPLPTSFRLTSCREIAPKLNEQIKNSFVPMLTGLDYEGKPLEAPKPLTWYPNQFAWQLNVPRQAIRKLDQFKRFQHFLVHEADVGNISRQEAVSMIPPLLLDVKPHHYVLDMAAAPGSKSVQLLEALHADLALSAEERAKDASKTIPPGLLIANDSDAKRCHLLVHQSLHRVPGAGMLVTNHDASQLPGLRLPSDLKQILPEGKFAADEEEKMNSEGEKKKYQALLFDRILADVPCSGDGTLRKNVGIWKEFSPGNGTGLHSLQLRILLRGLALLKPGGRLVYSTCSMNPIENEAVVSAALEACPDMSLVDVSDSLPNLIRRPGLTNWHMLDNKLEKAPHPNDKTATANYREQTADKKLARKVWDPSLWPNGKETERNLNRCIRIYPHLQDTGAFFVAVLEKAVTTESSEAKVPKTAGFAAAANQTESSASKRTAEERASSPAADQPEPKKPRQSAETELDAPAVPAEQFKQEKEALSSLPAEVAGQMFQRTKGDFKENPFIYINPQDEQVKICVDFFDLSPEFPVSQLLVRNAAGEALRSIYFTSSLARSLLLANSYSRMRLISCGVKMFTRQDSSRDGTYRCKWRIMSEGLDVIRPFMGPKRIVHANVDSLKMLMREMSVSIESLPEPELRERLNSIEPGSCVLEVKVTGEGVAFEQDLVLPFWRSVNSCNLMVEKSDKSALSLRFFGEDITPHKLQPKARDLKKAAEAEAASAAATPADEIVEADEQDLADAETEAEVSDSETKQAET